MKAVFQDDYFKHVKRLPDPVRRQTERALVLWRRDPFHASLHFKAAKTKGPFWSIRIGRQYRALALRETDTVEWFWVGHHDEYMKLLKRL